MWLGNAGRVVLQQKPIRKPSSGSFLSSRRAWKGSRPLGASSADLDTVRLIVPQFVIPYVKLQKNEANDAIRDPNERHDEIPHWVAGDFDSAGLFHQRQSATVTPLPLPQNPHFGARHGRKPHAARLEPILNRVMLAFAYDAGLRREELCSLRTDDIDPSRRTLRIRAETTKGRRERVVPYSVSSSELLHGYLLHRRTLRQTRVPLFLSESRRNYTHPISIWSKVVLGVARRARVERFSTHILRHLCLTDLARAGWDIHEIAAFAGHRSIQTTLIYIHLSGRDLSAKLAASMAQIHAPRTQLLAEVGV